MIETSSNSKPAGKKALIAYFSRSGNTREIAQQIHAVTGGTLFEIVNAVPYPPGYDDVVEVALKEWKASARPELKTVLEDANQYDVLFIGYPNWWSTFPMPVATFLGANGFSGKSIVPFCTHEGSRLGKSVADIAKLCPKAKILEGLALRGQNVKNAQNEVARWIEKL